MRVLAGLIIAAYSTGFMIGPQVAQLLLLDATTATLVAGGGCIAAFTVVLLAVPESRPPGSAAAGQGSLRLSLLYCLTKMYIWRVAAALLPSLWCCWQRRSRGRSAARLQVRAA